MPEPTAVDDLLAIMQDRTVSLRQRLNAAVSASRVERLQLPGEAPPESIKFLRWVVDYRGSHGEQLDPSFRREAAAATAYFERRSAKAALVFEIADEDERREHWRKLINSALRVHLSKAGQWPAGKHMLLDPSDEFAMPAIDPDVAHSALMTGDNRHQRRQRQKALDERLPGKWSGNETEPAEILRVIAAAAHQRLAQFDLADAL